MDENNNPAPGVEETEQMTVPRVKNLDPKLFVAVVVLIVVIVGIVITVLGKTQNPEQTPGVVPVVTPEVVVPATPTNPEKVSSGEALPEGFPKELILEEGVSIGEGYTVSYTESSQTQLTATFASRKTAKDNYEAYEKYLTEKSWIILNKYESDAVSSIYAMNRGKELNITIEATGDNSKLIISLLNN